MLLLCTLASAQLPNGSTAPDFTATDINGNSVHLYSYLNAGKPVIMDISATWCGPCWNFHQTHALRDLYNQYGPSGTNELMVIFVEGDASTTLANLNGSGNTQGDWVSGTPYPILDNASIANQYQIAYYPTLFMICPDKKIEELSVPAMTTAALYAKTQTCPAYTVVPNFNANLTAILQGTQIHFTDQTTGTPTSWSWSFPGGTPSTSTQQNPFVTYNTAGTYAVTLTATNAVPSTATLTKTSYITVITSTSAPAANFVVSNASPVIGSSITFTDQTAGNPTAWSWTFSGGTPSTSTLQNPVVTYNTLGTYQVTLTATNAYGTDIETKTNYIVVTPPVYCTASSVNGGYERIVNFSLGSINNASSYSNYSDYTSLSTSVAKGSSYPFTVNLGNSTSNDQVFIWIDFNHDGDFTDANEKVYSSPQSAGPFSGNITIPTTSTTGSTRMRIRLHDSQYGPNITPCGTSDWGEVEDYSINVLSQPTGLQEIEMNMFKIFPNPANTFIHLEISDPSLANYQVEVSDLLGRVQNVSMDISDSFYSINIETLLQGIYFVQIKNSADNKISILKFVKSR